MFLIKAYFVAFLFFLHPVSTGCVSLLEAGAFAHRPSKGTHWYSRHTTEDYVLSFSGNPTTDPVGVVFHSYYSDKFITRRSEVKQLGGPNAQLKNAMAECGLGIDRKGRIVFAGSTYKESIKDAYRLMETERQMVWKLSDEGWKRYHKEIDTRLDFAFMEYPKDWPKAFLDFLRQSAHQWDNAMHSSYVEVFTRTRSGKLGEQVGAFLNLAHPYAQYEIPAKNLDLYRRIPPPYVAQPLPHGTTQGEEKWIYTSGFPARRLTVEDFFGQEFPLPRVVLPDDTYVIQHRNVGMRKIGGVKSEPRNWRIKQGVSPKIFGEILIHYLRVLYDSEKSLDYNENGNFIYTYGPRNSVKRYAGIDPITGEKTRRGGLGFELLSSTPISRYDLQWWPLRSTPKKILDRLLTIEHDRGWNTEDADGLREAFLMLIEAQRKSADFVTK